MWHQATYSCFKTGLCEIAKDIGILDLQLHSNQRMRRSNQRRGVWGCHVELTENCTTPQRKITQGTNGRLVRLSFSLFFFSRRSFFFSFLITSSFSIFLISQNHFCSLCVLFLHVSLVVFGNHFLSSFCLFWSLYQDPEMRNTKMKDFMMEWRWAFLPSVAHLTSSGSCISHHMGEMNSSTSDEESCGGLSA